MVIQPPSLVIAMIFTLCATSQLFAQDTLKVTQDVGANAAVQPSAKTHFLIVGKSKVADPPEMQQRAIDAVAMIAESAQVAQPDAHIDSLAENLITMQQYRRGLLSEIVTGDVFKDRLRQLIKVAAPQDTVVIYTHSHGCKNGFERSQPLGGIVIDLPVKQLEHGGALLWDEYTDLLLQIPAKNVIVLTMSCFSGGFVEYLNSDPIKARWQGRHSNEGRNFIVLTSQNASLTSDPIMKRSEIINPFTYAASMALVGEADGFAIHNLQPVEHHVIDGKISVGEMIDFILHTTETTESDKARPINTAKPQSTGTYDREAVLFVLSPSTEPSRK